MKKRQTYLILASAFLIIAAIWLRQLSPVPFLAKQKQSLPASAQPTPILTKPSEEVLKQKINEGECSKQDQEKAFLSSFNTPINFWGKVVDQNGNPVDEADVKFSANDKYWEPGSKYTTKSDQNGLFSITKIKGINLSVDVEKGGYYRSPESYGAISYALHDPKERAIPTPNNPAIFVLRKIGETVPLIRVTERPIRVPKNGTPVEVSFATGQTMAAGQNGLKVECWTEDQNKNAQSQYTWRCRLSVPGGGLVERKGQFSFEAPPDGYMDVVEIEMPQSSSEWAKGVDKDYFAKLPGDRYARFTFGLTTGGDHFFVMASYLNPNPGNRNLEFDPAKAVKSP